MGFELQADYVPMGDQPEAIAKLAQSIRVGNRYQSLLGVTGSGKTFTSGIDPADVLIQEAMRSKKTNYVAVDKLGDETHIESMRQSLLDVRLSHLASII